MKKHTLLILAVGVFSILNTEMGVVGILPAISQQYHVSLTTAGLLVSLFALAIALSGPILPMLFSRFERKKIMVFVLGLFTVGNAVGAFAPNFATLLISRVIPAFFHPVYVSFSLAAASDFAKQKSQIPKAVSNVMIGVSTGMVLGAPVAGFIASQLHLRISFLFFAAVNFISLIATILLIPKFPKTEKISYGTQIGILKQKKLWLALIGVMLLNGSIFGVYSYVSSYLGDALGLGAKTAGIVLFVYGMMNIVGNAIAGKGLSISPNPFICIQPVVIGCIYILLLLTGGAVISAVPLIFLWGISAGMVANTIQYWVTSAAFGAPEFANGLYLTAANLGVSAATPFCGLFITQMGIQAAPLGGMVLVLFSAVCIALKACTAHKKNQKHYQPVQ